MIFGISQTAIYQRWKHLKDLSLLIHILFLSELFCKFFAVFIVTSKLVYQDYVSQNSFNAGSGISEFKSPIRR